ncbi:MAG: hypothetical protein IKV59_09360 [Lachnospiraceae bacterium]|nr:hypothetical protein [Lachnospiraceae bacterium]
MKKNILSLNSLLAMVVAAGLLLGIVWRAFQPNVVLPPLNIPAMAGLVLLALLFEFYLVQAEDRKRSYLIQALLAAVTFGILPWAADRPTAGLAMAVCGGIVFVVLTWIFDAAAGRAEATTDSRGVMVPTAFVLYLAFQCFMGMIL